MNKNHPFNMVFVILLMMTIFQNSLSQEYYSDKINQLNTKEQKDGLWVDSSKYRIREVYYKNGIKSGVFKQYDLKGRLLVFGVYCEDKMCETWYYFDRQGHIIMIFRDFSKNTNFIINEEDNRKYIPDYRCYAISYYPNGNIKDEGLLLWSEGEAPESDFSREYGKWYYYDETGKLVKTRLYK